MGSYLCLQWAFIELDISLSCRVVVYKPLSVSCDIFFAVTLFFVNVSVDEVSKVS